MHLSEPDDSEVVAAVSASATAKTAHHEAGHAVAAVARGGTLIKVHLGKVDWTTRDDSRDKPGETHHDTTSANEPFVTFAGPWAQAMWMVEHRDGVDEQDDFHDIVGYAWDDNLDGDGEKYEAKVAALENAVSVIAARMGFPGARVGARLGGLSVLLLLLGLILCHPLLGLTNSFLPRWVILPR